MSDRSAAATVKVRPGSAAPTLQRKCACGRSAASLIGDCPDCQREKALKLQRKIRVGRDDDPLEHEADCVAERVLALPESFRSPHNHGLPPLLPPSSASTQGDLAHTSVQRVLAMTGEPLDGVVRHDMERRFGHDFSRVRVHTGTAAERSAQEVGADAYTVGHNIVFGRDQFAPSAHSGRRLLAHELTHVVQQSGEAGRAPTLRRQKTGKKAPARKAAPKKPQMCGRDSRKVKDNWITKVNIDVGANTLTIEWNDPKNVPALSAGTHKISPGTGRCCVDCNDEKVSQTDGSLCTPKGDTWKVDSTGCVLAGHPSAKNPTYFQRGGIAIHSGNTSSPPRSHGCSRTSVEISELIHDNVVPKKTEISSSGTWSSTKCYLNAKTDKLSNRKDVCDGNKLKTEKAGKKTKAHGGANAPAQMPTDTPPPTPVAEAPTDTPESPLADALEPESEELIGIAMDGPGPQNEPLSHESIGEEMAEPDSIETADESDVG